MVTKFQLHVMRDNILRSIYLILLRIHVPNLKFATRFGRKTLLKTEKKHTLTDELSVQSFMIHL